jgi:hypothetical protein
MYMIYTRSVITWGYVIRTLLRIYQELRNKWILFNDDSVSVIDDIEKLFSPHAHTVSLQNSGDDDDLE